MTPKEKAKELVDKYLNAPFNCKNCDMPYCDIKCTILTIGASKICALIAVDELINDCDASSPFEVQRLNYWQEVKQEINNI